MKTSAPGLPSGKTAATENFPVASLLLPARLRPHVMAFYAFARQADDIADSPDLPAAEKIALLDRMGAALTSGDGGDIASAGRLRESLAATGVTSRHATDLLDAFRQDAVKSRYADWDELIAYCDRSAAPVGRYLLDLHGEAPLLHPASDALCAALQILNHLQDCAEDYRVMDRVYIPEPWLAAEGIGVDALAGTAITPALRRVLDRMLDKVDALLALATPLPAALGSRRLAMETATILAIARRLAARLRGGDPLAGRVALDRGEYMACLAEGIGQGFMQTDADAREMARVAASSGTSFYWAMRLLARPRRQAMFAVYAFCREVDDIADGTLAAEEKTRRLDAWRAEVARLYAGRPATRIGRALLGPIARYGLAREDFDAVIDGVAMDADGTALSPDMATLLLYCDRVAGAVGLLSVRAFGDGSETARRGALAQGRAMQLTNILRDLTEDAERGRLYLPRELLAAQGIGAVDPAAVLAHPAIGVACAELAAVAARHYGEAEAEFAGRPRRPLRPARAMMAVYRLLLDRLRARGWERLAERPRIGRATKLWIALRASLS